MQRGRAAVPLPRWFCTTKHILRVLRPLPATAVLGQSRGVAHIAKTDVQVTSDARWQGETSLPTFDPATLGDEGIRREFEFLERRARSACQSLQDAFGKPIDAVSFRYIDDREYNAYAGLVSGRYQVELNAAVPLFNLALFYGLLSDKRFLPRLDSAGMAASHFTVPFAIDPSDFERTAEWKVSCSPIRAFAAGTLADICSTFVVLHELGHVLCGHCEGIKHFGGGDAIAELVAIRRSSVADIDRRLAWEADADMIGGGLLAQFVEGLVADIKPNGRTADVFSDPDGYDLEHTTAIVIASLFVLFCYIEGTRHRFEKSSTHPHPQVRALLIKNVLQLELERRGEFDADAFHRHLDEHLDSAMTALESLGVFDPKEYTSGFSRSVDRQFSKLKLLQDRHRAECARWAWIGWSRN